MPCPDPNLDIKMTDIPCTYFCTRYHCLHPVKTRANFNNLLLTNYCKQCNNTGLLL